MLTVKAKNMTSESTVNMITYFQTGIISEPSIQIGDNESIEAEDYFNHVEIKDEKQIKQNQGIERLDSLSSSSINQGERRDSSSSAQVSFEASGVRPKKPCNCTKSQCLKL